MPAEAEYKVELEVFEGPLDLLLYLIRKDEIDIYDIPIERITTQYVEYMNLMRMLDLNIAGEFIVMAATLMMIKSRMLLPVEDRPDLEEEEAEDPRWDLVRQLVEYKKFKDVALGLETRAQVQANVFQSGGGRTETEPETGLVMRELTIFDLIAAFNEALKKAEPEVLGEVVGSRFTVADKIEAVLQLLKQRESLDFSELFGHRTGRHEIVCTFLALLELIRLRQVRAVQDGSFGEIRLVRIAEAVA